MRPELAHCPSCGGEIITTRYSCPACDIHVEGRFARNRFTRLTPEAQDFLFVFVKNRGNIREVERELGISYPTVRNRLNAVIAELGITDRDEWSPEEIAAERLDILRELDEGKLSTAEAEELLNTLNELNRKQGGRQK
ncbi:DUF2089 domain-containing protein [Candidatus Poribacteria bacterium]|nr:DUF2089 domain-containing protein [Candidatus Poribacteria bacterium]